MLTLLIGVFVWRTVTFDSAKSIECHLKPNCVFTVKNETFSAERLENKILLKKPSDDWTIKTQASDVQIIEKAEFWELHSNKNSDFEITISDLEENNLAGVRFRI